MGDIYVLDFRLLKKMLLALDNLLQEVFVQDAIIGQVKLDYEGVRYIRYWYSRCSERYWVKSYLDLNLNFSS